MTALRAVDRVVLVDVVVLSILIYALLGKLRCLRFCAAMPLTPQSSDLTISRLASEPMAWKH